LFKIHNVSGLSVVFNISNMTLKTTYLNTNVNIALKYARTYLVRVNKNEK